MKSLSFMVMFAAGLLARPAQAATPLERLNQELQSQSQSVETLATSSDELRQAALEAAAYPNVLWEMDREQKRSSEQFQRLITSYPRKTQEKIYDLVRYPNLVEDLVEGGPKSKDQIKEMTRQLPKGIQDAAKELGTKEYALLRDIRNLNLQSDRDLENSLQGIPESSRQAYRTLLGHPEILRALSDDRDLTVAMGDAYRANPAQARTKLDEFSAQVARQQEEALSDYRQTLANDPKAREDLKKSAKAFAKENGYDDYDDYYPPPQTSSSQTVVNININPYPYWFGYPYWYSVPVWRPYPLWYWTGFWGWDSGFYVWGFPSYYYTSWFYGYPRHFYRYPYLSSCYGNYYYRWRGNPYYYNGFYRGVNGWYNRYGYRAPITLYRGDSGSAQRWRDYGERQEVQRRRYTPTSASYQPYWRDKPGRDGKGKPDFVKGSPRGKPGGDDATPASGRHRGRFEDGAAPGSGSPVEANRRGGRPKIDRGGSNPGGFQPGEARENPRGRPNVNARTRDHSPADKTAPSSPGVSNRPGFPPPANRAPERGGGSYGFRDSDNSSSFGSGRSRSSWGGGSPSGFRERSSFGGSFGGGSGRSRSPSFHSGGSGRGRR